jgi:hypothetical protein
MACARARRVRKWLAFVKDGSNRPVPKIAPQARRNLTACRRPGQVPRDESTFRRARPPKRNDCHQGQTSSYHDRA